MTVSHLLRSAAWIGVLLLVAASWIPSPYLVRTGMYTQLEHSIAYLLTGIALMWAYPHRLPVLVAIALVAFAAVLEIGQIVVPERHAALIDWAASAAGAICALVLTVAVRGAAGRRQ